VIDTSDMTTVRTDDFEMFRNQSGIHHGDFLRLLGEPK
jgi:hypothetical protein